MTWRVPSLAVLAVLAVAVGVARTPAQAAERDELTVAVAANLRPAFERIAAAYEGRHPGARVRATFGGSVAFYSQIVQGAPFDVFLSADAELPERLAAARLTAGPPFVYARGALVLWVPRGSSLPIDREGIGALRAASVRKIAMPNPRTAPYGRAAEEALRAAGVLDALLPKLVLGQSVAQAAQFAETGAADAALLPASMVHAPPLSRDGRWVAVPEGMYGAIVQAGVVLASSARRERAASFCEFLRGPEARRILADLGYAAPGP